MLGLGVRLYVEVGLTNGTSAKVGKRRSSRSLGAGNRREPVPARLCDGWSSWTPSSHAQGTVLVMVLVTLHPVYHPSSIIVGLFC